MADSKLYQYYQRQNVLPTYGGFTSIEDLSRYARGRHDLFAGKLGLPLQAFRASALLEFGPDSGENALVFARWGANLTLVEPNARAHDQIRAYFAKFKLDHTLQSLVQADVESFSSVETYDIIDAEGFIYTVQPTDKWLGIFHDLLKPDGYAVISYYERAGGIFELSLRAIQAAGKALLKTGSREAADALFRAKWDAIPHTRRFESWVMDVLENPFARLRYFLSAEDLVRRADAKGFALHASWPHYRDALSVYWHKKLRSDSNTLASNLAHIRRSRLSFAAGRQLYLTGTDEEVEAIGAALDTLASLVDEAIETPARASAAAEAFGALDARVANAAILAGEAEDLSRYRATLDSFKRIFSAIAAQDGVALKAITGADPAFIAEWGLPAHFCVLRKRSV